MISLFVFCFKLSSLYYFFLFQAKTQNLYMSNWSQNFKKLAFSTFFLYILSFVCCFEQLLSDEMLKFLKSDIFQRTSLTKNSQNFFPCLISFSLDFTDTFFECTNIANKFSCMNFLSKINVIILIPTLSLSNSIKLFVFPTPT
jgi:hypothetical protein